MRRRELARPQGWLAVLGERHHHGDPQTRGRLIGFAKVTRDLTERRLAEEKREAERNEAERVLRESEETFRLLVDGVRDYAIFFLDPEGHVMTWNAGAERIKGYRADEIIGQSFVRFYLPQDVIAGVPSRLLRRATEQGVATDEGVRVRKDGSRFWASVVISALHDESGRSTWFRQGHARHQRPEARRAVHGDSRRYLAPPGGVARFGADPVHHHSHGRPRLCRRSVDPSEGSAG